jgi:hypothetical protein
VKYIFHKHECTNNLCPYNVEVSGIFYSMKTRG